VDASNLFWCRIEQNCITAACAARLIVVLQLEILGTRAVVRTVRIHTTLAARSKGITLVDVLEKKKS
jgi:hypothetical protein